MFPWQESAELRACSQIRRSTCGVMGNCAPVGPTITYWRVCLTASFPLFHQQSARPLHALLAAFSICMHAYRPHRWWWGSQYASHCHALKPVSQRFFYHIIMFKYWLMYLFILIFIISKQTFNFSSSYFIYFWNIFILIFVLLKSDDFDPFNFIFILFLYSTILT